MRVRVRVRAVRVRVRVGVKGSGQLLEMVFPITIRTIGIDIESSLPLPDRS